MDYETEKMLEDIRNEIYCELDEIRNRHSAYVDDGMGYQNMHNGQQNYNRSSSYGSDPGPKKEWQEYWAK